MIIRNLAEQREPGERIVRTRECLLAVLETVDREGWDASAGTRLLTFVRTDVVWPLVVDWGLRGGAASQAEASGWQAAWHVLAAPSLRKADSPWGVVWTAVRHAIQGEAAAALFGKSERRSWELLAERDGVPRARLESLDKWADSGLDAASDDYLAERVDFANARTVAATALAAAGWGEERAYEIVTAVVELQSLPRDPRSTVVGWRTMADELALPPWQARRLSVVLLGTAEWRGLLPRLLLDGSDALREPGIEAALRSTRVRRHRSPVLAARRGAATASARYPQQIAS